MISAPCSTRLRTARNRRAVAAGSVRPNILRKSSRRFFPVHKKGFDALSRLKISLFRRRHRKSARVICRFSGLVCRVRAKPQRYEMVCRVLRYDQRTRRHAASPHEMVSVPAAPDYPERSGFEKPDLAADIRSRHRGVSTSSAPAAREPPRTRGRSPRNFPSNHPR